MGTACCTPLFVAFIAVALANVFGQRASTETATGERAALELTAPGNVRSGLIYRYRFRIEARARSRNPSLVLDPAGSTVSRSTRFSPTRSSSRNGKARSC